jgi:hypothetical protein
MVAIFGSFSSSAKPTYDKFLLEFEKLPKEVVITAPASFAFPSRTPGIHYLLLTAYRIETLLHVCFVTLLENIHELMWSMPLKSGCPLKRSSAGVHFRGDAWYAPSWVERVELSERYGNS